MQEGFGLKVVKTWREWHHRKRYSDSRCSLPGQYTSAEAGLDGRPDFPIALGVIREVEAPTYNDAVSRTDRRSQRQEEISQFPRVADDERYLGSEVNS